MNGNELVDLFKQGSKRCHVIGSVENGVIAGLDLEGRLYAVMNGTVLNRVNPAAILGIITRSSYLNPGGDGLWPAPEGTCFGYEYATGQWRVPPGLTGGKFVVTEQRDSAARIEAEVELINSQGAGLPTIFSRDISIFSESGRLTVGVVESIRYIGAKTFKAGEFLLAPWTLCQFDCGPGCEVVFPKTADADVWDLYDPSDDCRSSCDGLVHTRTDCSKRYQIAIGESVPWIEFRNPAEGLVVKRTAAPLPAGQRYIDISDAPPTASPLEKGVRFSVYSDTAGFMEIEAAGGCGQTLEPGTTLAVEVITEYQKTH